jgi:hypothetical protein
LFDPIFNEANESSSACEPGIELHVETNTPPIQSNYIGMADDIKRTCVKYEQRNRPALTQPPQQNRVSLRRDHWKNLMTKGYS